MRFKYQLHVQHYNLFNLLNILIYMIHIYIYIFIYNLYNFHFYFLFFNLLVSSYFSRFVYLTKKKTNYKNQ